MGNLFDAVSSLIGIRNETTYESQAAMEMLALARPFIPSIKCYPFVLETTETGTVIRLKDLLAAVLHDVRSHRSTEMIAARFHKTIAEMAVDVCRRARRFTGLNEVALSGNMWQNQVMLDLVHKGLTRDGFTVYTHRDLPSNDGGLALGQAVVANSSRGIRELATPQRFTPVTQDDRPPGEKVNE